MYRLATILLVLLLAACGTDSGSEKPESQPTNGQASEDKKDDNSEGNDSVAEEGLQLNVVSFNEEKAVIELQNQTGSTQELEFSSGQQYDMWITDQDGKQVFHWGEGKMFTQALKTITIESGGKHTFEVAIPKLDPGTYKVKFKVTSKPPFETTFTHTIG